MDQKCYIKIKIKDLEEIIYPTDIDTFNEICNGLREESINDKFFFILSDLNLVCPISQLQYIQFLTEEDLFEAKKTQLLQNKIDYLSDVISVVNAKKRKASTSYEIQLFNSLASSIQEIIDKDVTLTDFKEDLKILGYVKSYGGLDKISSAIRFSKGFGF